MPRRNALVLRAKPASPTSLTALRTRFSMQKICPLLQHDHGAGVQGRRHGVGVLRVPFPGCHRPCNLPPRAFQPGFAIAALAARGAPMPSAPGRVSGPAPGNCDPTRASTPHAGGILVGLRRQRPHAVPRHEPHHLVGRSDAQGRRMLGRIGIGENGSVVRGPWSAIEADRILSLRAPDH